MGIHVDVYKPVTREGDWFHNYDCTNGGESHTARGFTVMNAEGPHKPCADYPAATLVVEGRGRWKILSLIPDSKKNDWNMFGGNYAGCSDSRFGKLCEKLIGGKWYGAVAIHDRVPSNDWEYPIKTCVR
jgi:hypothetical protein